MGRWDLSRVEAYMLGVPVGKHDKSSHLFRTIYSLHQLDYQSRQATGLE